MKVRIFVTYKQSVFDPQETIKDAIRLGPPRSPGHGRQVLDVTFAPETADVEAAVQAMRTNCWLTSTWKPTRTK